MVTAKTSCYKDARFRLYLTLISVKLSATSICFKVRKLGLMILKVKLIREEKICVRDYKGITRIGNAFTKQSSPHWPVSCYVAEPLKAHWVHPEIEHSISERQEGSEVKDDEQYIELGTPPMEDLRIDAIFSCLY